MCDVFGGRDAGVACRYALGDLLEMAGYGLVERAASNARISGMQTDPTKVLQTLPQSQGLISHVQFQQCLYLREVREAGMT